jgi:YD repeat-containing protein
MNKTIAQQLFLTEFPFTIKDKNGNQIYYEDSNGYWSKSEYDQNGKLIYFENSHGNWCKYEYDQNGNRIYYEASDGHIIDNRPKVVELTLDEIAAKLNIDVNLLKIKK